MYYQFRFSVVLSCYLERFSISLQVSLSLPSPALLEQDFVCLWLEVSKHYHYCCYSLWIFLHQRLLIVSHQSLSHSKSSEVSKTLLSILIDLNTAVVRRVSSYFQIFQSLYQVLGNCSKRTNYYFYHAFFFKFHYFTHCKFFTPAIAGGVSQESERQQVFSRFQDSSQYSIRSW